MLKGLAVFGAAVVIGIGFLGNAQGTGACLIAIITTRGVSFLLRKMTWSLSKEMADLLDFTAWCVCAIPAVSIIKNAQAGLQPISNFFASVNNFFVSMSNNFDKLAQFIDKLTFWN